MTQRSAASSTSARMNDHRGIAAQFQGHFFLSGFFFHGPAHRHAAGERKQFQARRRRPGVQRRMPSGRTLKPPARKADPATTSARSSESAESEERVQDTNPNTGGHGGRDLCATRFEWEVKRGDGENRSQRKSANNSRRSASRPASPAEATRRRCAWLLPLPRRSKNPAIDFAARGLDGFPASSAISVANSSRRSRMPSERREDALLSRSPGVFASIEIHERRRRWPRPRELGCPATRVRQQSDHTAREHRTARHPTPISHR